MDFLLKIKQKQIDILGIKRGYLWEEGKSKTPFWKAEMETVVFVTAAKIQNHQFRHLPFSFSFLDFYWFSLFIFIFL